MATATSRLRLEKQAYNANDNSWGQHLNDGVFDLADEAFGVEEIAVGANVTLSQQNYLTDQSRKLVLIFSGAGGFTVTAPAVDKPYLVINNCSAAVTLKPAGGTGASIGAGMRLWYYTNAAGTVGYFVNPKLNDLAAPDDNVSLNSKRLTNVAAAVNANDAVTRSNTITDLAPPGSNLNLNSKRIINLAEPASSQDAATKNYVDALVNSTDLGVVAGIAADVTAVADISTEVVAVAADTTNIDAVGTNINNVNTVAGISADVTSVAGNSADISTVASVSADVSAVGAVASDVTTVAGNAADVATVAGVTGDVTTVSGIASAVVNVSTNMADVQNASALVDGLSLSAGTGLTSTGDLSAGQTISADVGTTANKLVQLDGSARLPAVDGSQLTGIAASQTTYGTPVTISNNAAVDFTLESGADEWFFILKNVIPAIDNKGISFAGSTDGGSTFTVATNRLEVFFNNGGGPNLGIGTAAAITTPDYLGNAANEEGLSGYIHILPLSGKRTRFIAEYTGINPSGYVSLMTIRGEWATTSTITHIRFTSTSGNISSGTITAAYVSY